MSKNTKRKPQWLGSGMYGLMITDCIKGDTFFDCDMGYIIYNGKKWVQNNDPNNFKKMLKH